MGFLTSFVKSGEICKTFILLQNNSRTTRGEKSTQFLTGTTCTLFYGILKTKIRKREKH